jgi:Protein of unknown function (DUF3591)
MKRTSIFQKCVDGRDRNVSLLTCYQREFGTPFVLQPSDDTPFLKLGSVAPGQTVPSLYNNMIRAPIFEQKAYPTDFLVVR